MSEGGRPSRASDYYVPVGLVVSGVGTIASVVMIVSPIFNNLTGIENRLTRIETRMEQIQELKQRIEDLEDRCNGKNRESRRLTYPTGLSFPGSGTMGDYLIAK